MNLTLTWKNFNVVPVSMAIYRGDAPLDPMALPAPLVTLTEGEEIWVDSTVTRGQLYYYMFVTTGATDKVPSRNYPIRAVSRRGHGPTDLLYGDYELGYFGELTALEFATSADILKAIGFNGTDANSAIGNKTGLPVWHKFAYQGKILYIPNGAIAYSASLINWYSLAQKGAVYGTDTAFPDFTTPKHNTVQNAGIDIGPNRYRIRLPRGTENDPATPYTEVIESITTGNAEWDALVATLIIWINANQKLPNTSNIAHSGFGFISSTRGIMCQEVTPANMVVERGGTSQSVEAVARIATSVNILTGSPYLPVLELIES